MSNSLRSLVTIASAATFVAVSPLNAADKCETPTGMFPNPVNIYVGYQAGGPTAKLGEEIAPTIEATGHRKVKVVPDFEIGDGTMTATRAVVGATAPRSPSTVPFATLLTHEALVYGWLHEGGLKSGIDIRKLEPVGLVAKVPMVLIARKDMAHDMGSLIEYLRTAKRGARKIEFAHAGYGSNSHRCLLNIVTNLLGGNWNGVGSYAGHASAGDALNAVEKGDKHAICDQSREEVVRRIRQNAVKGLVVFAESTPPALSREGVHVDTAKGAGFPGLDFSSWHAMWAAPGTPDDVVGTMHRGLQYAMKDQALRDRWHDYGWKTAYEVEGMRSCSAQNTWRDHEIRGAEKLVCRLGLPGCDAHP